MMHTNLLSKASIITTLLGALLLPRQASALQPLDEFLGGARSRSFQAREQNVTVQQREQEHNAALGRLLPVFTATGTLTHNQYQAMIPAGAIPGQTKSTVIQPYNQTDAIIRLDVPLIDLASAARYRQTGHIAEAAQAQREATESELDRGVARAYYSFIGASALAAAAQRSVELAQDNLGVVSARCELGAATELDRERARANVERSKQDQADAELLRLVAARQLETLTGVSPTAVAAYPLDDLRREAPLTQWIAGETPAAAVRAHLSDAAEAGHSAARRALLPTLSASAQERLTNATGFAGRSAFYTLQASLTWRLDYGSYANSQAQATAAELQHLQSEHARRDEEDAIFEAFHRVGAGIKKSESARAQSAAASKAAALAKQRYEAGAATQYDVTQTQRDAFQAEVARIQADADLAFSRIALRISAGKPLTVPALTTSTTLTTPTSDNAPETPATAQPPETQGTAPQGTAPQTAPQPTPPTSPSLPPSPAPKAPSP